MTRPTIAFVTFGGGLTAYRRAARRIAAEASDTGWCTDVRCLHERDLDRRFREEHRSLLRPSVRGFGYWLWKPRVILDVLQASDADVVVYCDAGSSLRDSPRRALRFRSYADLAMESRGVVSFDLGLVESRWCKADTLQRVDPAGQHWHTNARAGGTLYIHRNAEVIDLVDTWLRIAAESHYHFIDDSPSVAPDDPRFREHRHDQSILSLLTKAAGHPAPADMLGYPDFGADTDSPIWTTRHMSGVPYDPSDRYAPGERVRLVAERVEYRVERRLGRCLPFRGPTV